MDRFDQVRARKPEARVRALSRAYIDYSLAEPNLFKLLFLYPPDIGGTGVEHELPMATKVFLAAAEPLEEGIESGEFTADDAAAASLAVWAAVHGCATALSLDFGFDDAGVEPTDRRRARHGGRRPPRLSRPVAPRPDRS